MSITTAAPSVPPLETALRRYRTGMHILLEGAQAQTAQTPKEVIWTKNKAKLYHYYPIAEPRFAVPILMVYALINRSYVLDLMPGTSLIEYLVNQGFEVYLLDWGTPGDEDANLSFEHYVLDYIPQAVKRLLRHAHAQEFTLLGYCMGGTMSLMYASLFPEKLRNLLLLTTPSDFTPDYLGLYGAFTSARYFDPDALADALGNIPGEMIDHGNRLVKPVANYVGSYVTMWDRVLNDKPMDLWLAMSKWVNDGVPFPGAVFKQWIREFYQDNKLVQGEIVLRGQRVDLSNITCPVLNVAGTQDHICSVPMAQTTMRLIRSEDKEFFTMNAGHVGLLTSPDTKRILWPKLREWLSARSRPIPAGTEAGSTPRPGVQAPLSTIGKRASLTRIITEADIKTFARLSGDYNPIHLDAEYAAHSPFGERIAHGFLVGSLLSALLGTDLPGPGTIYLGQTLKFLAPVHIGDKITVTAEVIAVREDKRILSLRCDWANQEGRSVLTGEATVKC